MNSTATARVRRQPTLWQRVLGLPISAAIMFSTQAATAHQLLVKWRDGPESRAAAEGNRGVRATSERNFSSLGWQLVRLPDGMSVIEGLQAYRALATVQAVEPNGPIRQTSPDPLHRGAPQERDTVRPSAVARHNPTASSTQPNDPLFREQWYLRKINATNAWATTTGSSNVVVAVIDIGVNYTHPDLADNMWRNPGETGLDALGRDKATNQVDDDQNGYVDDVFGIDAAGHTGDPMDKASHGTFIAGLIGATGNNAVGIAGLNWSVGLMAVGIAETPTSAHTSDGITLAAFDYVVMMKKRGVNVRVINCSWGDYTDRLALRDAIEVAGKAGILTVCAVGNSTVNLDLWTLRPAGFAVSSILTVAASDETDAPASFSNYGGSVTDMAAPGVNMISTSTGSSYQRGRNGASHAAPLVAGAAALLLSVDPNLTVHQVKAALLGSVDPVAALRGKVVTHGRLNVGKALQRLTNPDPPVIVIHASPAGSRTRPDESIELTFSRPMNRESVENALSITPAIDATFEWSADARAVMIHHTAPFDAMTSYSARLRGSAQDEAGGSLDGDFDGKREGSPADDFVWTFRFQTPNDDFENAQMLTGTSGSVQASTRHTFIEWNEPQSFLSELPGYGSSVWYRWTAPESGWITLDLTSGTAHDSILITYTGERIDQLTGIAGNDNYGAKTASRLSFEAQAGRTYSWVVAGKDQYTLDAAGSFRLNWYPTPPPGFTGAQFFPASAAPGTKITLTGTNFTGATGVLFNGASATFANALTNNLDLRITAIVPPDATSGRITIVTPHGSVTSTASFQVLPPLLRITSASANQPVVSWASTSPEFLLESSEQVEGAAWVAVPEKPVIGKEGSSVTLATEPSTRFLRLRKASP